MTRSAPVASPSALPDYVIPVAVVVPVVAAAGITVLTIMLVKKRHQRKRSGDNELKGKRICFVRILICFCRLQIYLNVN